MISVFGVATIDSTRWKHFTYFKYWNYSIWIHLFNFVVCFSPIAMPVLDVTGRVTSYLRFISLMHFALPPQQTHIHFCIIHINFSVIFLLSSMPSFCVVDRVRHVYKWRRRWRWRGRHNAYFRQSKTMPCLCLSMSCQSIVSSRAFECKGTRVCLRMINYRLIFHSLRHCLSRLSIMCTILAWIGIIHTHTAAWSNIDKQRNATEAYASLLVKC